jgi:protein involved in polysaccharide export with SLBB domain
MGARTAAAAALLLALAAGESAAPRTAATQTAAEPAAPAAAAEPARPGDLVRLRIWREPDLSGDFPVEEDGAVVLPRLGRVEVAGEDPAALRARLSAAYGEFLQHASVSVTLLRRVRILGAVRNPGLYPVDPTMTVADALALAGGTTLQGAPRTVQLVRDGRPLTARLDPDALLANSRLRSGDQLYVPERSWISRNAGVVSAALSATVTVAVALMRRR